MAMKVATFNGCKVYNLSSGKTMPQWLSENKRRAMAKDEEYRKRLELIQDFEMTVASQCIKMTGDGEHIIVTGTYPPVVKCYTVSDLALKFQRGLTCDVVAFESLSDDFGKIVFLQSDRTINFHAPYGTHYSVRVPKFGRDLAYNWENCDLFVGGSGDEIFRLNLELGQFREPFKLAHPGCNKMHINSTHRLLGCGGEEGVCEFFDLRTRSAVSKLYVDQSKSTDVTALKFDDDGLTLGVGTSNGNCILYDIRSSVPLYTKEHQYGLPVINVAYHRAARQVISADKKIVKIWDRDEPNMGKIMTNIETPADINDVLLVEDKRGQSGMLMMAGEQSRVMTYFVPQLGPAPRWCSFLEGITEELEESVGQSVYEDYKFLTKAEVEDLGASALIGTPMLKGYMHGFFIEMKLYNKLRAVSKPFEYEEYRLQKIRDKIEERRQSRITAVKRLPKVNKALADKLLKQQKSGSKSSKAGEGDDSKLVDDRFADLFSREEFQVDEDSAEFKLANPNKGNNRREGDGDSEDELRDIYTPVHGTSVDDVYEDDDDGDVPDDAASDDSDDEDEEARRFDRKKRRSSAKRSKDDEDDNEEDGQILKASRIAALASRIREKHDAKFNLNGPKATSRSKHSGPRMFEIADGVDSASTRYRDPATMKSKREAIRLAGSVPLTARLQEVGKAGGSNSTDSSIRYVRNQSDGLMKEISFVPKGRGGGKPGAKPKSQGDVDDYDRPKKN